MVDVRLSTGRILNETIHWSQSLLCRAKAYHYVTVMLDDPNGSYSLFILTFHNCSLNGISNTGNVHIHVFYMVISIW